jgi:hypothetical protein
MSNLRMDNVLVVVDDLETAKAFFANPGRPWTDQTGYVPHTRGGQS